MSQPETRRTGRRSRLRRAILLAALLGFLFWLGANYPSPPQALMCKVYG
jgi:hypothetical protein